MKVLVRIDGMVEKEKGTIYQSLRTIREMSWCISIEHPSPWSPKNLVVENPDTTQGQFPCKYIYRDRVEVVRYLLCALLLLS